MQKDLVCRSEAPDALSLPRAETKLRSGSSDMTRLRDPADEQPRLPPSRLLLMKQRPVEVVLHRGFLAWRDSGRSRKRGSGSSETARCSAVQVCEILAVWESEGGEGGGAGAEAGRSHEKSQQHLQQYPHAFTVSYVRRTRRHQWRCSDVTFRCASRGDCEQWVRVIDQQLALLTNRPRSLLVYINPYGGKRRGRSIYEQKVAPLFHRAGISTEVIVTEYANHARDHLKTEAVLDKYDGVVCVGGDGMFSEIMHGLVTKTQTDHSVDPNRSDADLVRCSLRIGIIPAGSTDCICFATVGTNDPITSALHIIVGDSQPMDVCSVHHNDIFLRYSVSLLGYGFYGDVLTDSERKRWLGPARYDLSGLKAFLNHNYYEGTVSFLPAQDNMGNPRDKLQCRSGCHVCQHEASSKGCAAPEESEKSDEESKGGWTEMRGKFIAINAASMSCASPRSPKGLSPSAHLADGTTDLILVRKCSRLDFLRHLLRHTNKDDQFDHPFVEVHRVRRFRFTPRHHEEMSLEDLSAPPKTVGFRPICSAAASTCNSFARSSWNCDGEILPHAAIQVSVQSQLIRLFARGIEEQQQCVFEDPHTLWTPEPAAR